MAPSPEVEMRVSARLPAPILGLVAGTAVGTDTIGQLGAGRPGSDGAALPVLLATAAVLALLASVSRRLAVAVAASFSGWVAGTALAAAAGSGHGLGVLATGILCAQVALILVLLVRLDGCFLVLAAALAVAWTTVAAGALLAAGDASLDRLVDATQPGDNAPTLCLGLLTLAGVVAHLASRVGPYASRSRVT